MAMGRQSSVHFGMVLDSICEYAEAHSTEGRGGLTLSATVNQWATDKIADHLEIAGRTWDRTQSITSGPVRIIAEHQ